MTFKCSRSRHPRNWTCDKGYKLRPSPSCILCAAFVLWQASAAAAAAELIRYGGAVRYRRPRGPPRKQNEHPTLTETERNVKKTTEKYEQKLPSCRFVRLQAAIFSSVDKTSEVSSWPGNLIYANRGKITFIRWKKKNSYNQHGFFETFSALNTRVQRHGLTRWYFFLPFISIILFFFFL